MKFSKILCLAALLSAPAIAQPIYIDVNFNGGNNANPKADGPTTTGWIDKLQFAYNSWSTVFDANGNLTIDAGDVITSTGGILGSGFNMSLFSGNVFTSFLPSQTGGGPSRNGFSDSWGMTFGFNNLTGTFTNSSDISWQSGTISMYYYNEADLVGCPVLLNCITRMFDLEVTGGGNIPSGMLINGYLTNFNMVDTPNGIAAGDMFNTTFGGTNQSFNSIYNTLVGAGYPMSFNFLIDQNVEQLPAVTGYNPVTQTFTLARAEHDGTVQFSIPEPASIAILGLGLLGIGFRGRMKRKA